MEIQSSQELVLISSQNSYYDNNDNDLYQIWSQDLNKTSTQEAIIASDYLNNLELKSSQESVRNEDKSDSSLSPKRKKCNEIENNAKEKKKRGRKKKIRTEEEWDQHLKDKKEKNRLAAQRLRQRKSSEYAKYETEVEKYEELVKTKRHFAQHLKSKVDQLRDRIKSMAPEKRV